MEQELSTLSVVVCTYNGAKYLREQLDSVLEQTLQPDEIIVHDDGSTDETLDLANEYAQRCSRLRVIRNKGPHGVNGNFFNALRAAQGTYIAICDQDDIWEPTKLQKQMAVIGNNLLCGCVSRPFSTDGSPVNVDMRPANLSPLRMMYVGMMPGHTLLLHRDALQWVPNGNFFMYDLQLQMVAALQSSIAYVPEVLVHQRRYPQATTYMKPQSKLQMLYNTFRNYKRLKPQVRRRFRQWNLFLTAQSSKPFTETPELHQALLMCKLQRGTGLWTMLRLTAFCIRHRSQILPTPTIKGLRAICFAALFPLTCINYYRYFLDRK